MRGEQKRDLLRSLVLWLVFGLAAGIFAAVVVTRCEYRNMARLAGAEYLLKYGYGPWDGFLRNLFLFSGLFVLLSEGVGLIFYWRKLAGQKRIYERVDALTEYLRSVNDGKASTLSRREDEFSHLEDELYKTVTELTCTKEAAVKDHGELSRRIADIAHQLKTPLTSMALMTELLEAHKTSETEEYLTRLSGQVQRLQSLTAGLLTLSRLDSHTLEFFPERQALSGLLKRAAEPLLQLMEQQGIFLHIASVPDNAELYVELDPRWTQEALLNILKNCMEHTPRGGTVEVRCTQNQLYTELVIQDEGKGIAPKDLPHIFERFYRGEGAANDSAGIGLALAKMIIEKQKGHIRGENSPEGHARFVVRFYGRRTGL